MSTDEKEPEAEVDGSQATVPTGYVRVGLGRMTTGEPVDLGPLAPEVIQAFVYSTEDAEAPSYRIRFRDGRVVQVDVTQPGDTEGEQTSKDREGEPPVP